MKNALTLPRLLSDAPLPKIGPDGDKEKRGQVLVVGGGIETPGAVLLTGLACLRAGAGKLAIATVEPVCVALAIAVPEARVIALPSTARGEIAPGALPRLEKHLGDPDALVLGPGMLDEAVAGRLCERLLVKGGPAGFVMDAAAMTGLIRRAKAVRRASRALVITPHAGEMAAMLDCEKSAVEAAPMEAAQKVAETLGAVVALKGATTYVITPDGGRWVHKGGAVGLGTSGSGDVLAGIIGGLMARGASPEAAAAWGVYVHGAAGGLLADSMGELGFLAREILPKIPGVLMASNPKRGKARA